MFTQVAQIIRKEIKEDMRQKSLIGSVLLYVVSTTFVAFLSFKRILDVPTWNALLWIILLFASVNTVSNSIAKESNENYRYLFTQIPPRAFILGKIFYNALFMGLVSLVTYVVYLIFLGDLVQLHGAFVIILFLGATGLSAIFTLTGSIAARSSNGVGLSAILGFPITLPLLITTIKASKNAVDGIDWNINLKYVIVQLSINLIIIMLSYLLFPYLWRD